MRGLPARLLAVTDRTGSDRPLPETVRALVKGGLRWVWLRDRDLPRPERAALARALRDILEAVGGGLVVGGDAELAAAVGAQGVHLGAASGTWGIVQARRHLGPTARIGVSTHSLAEVRTAAEAGADYATLSPIFASASKPGYGPALGPETLRAATDLALPVLALGGIGPAQVRACRAAGAAGVAVMGALMRAHDPAAAARDLATALDAPT